MQDALHHPLHVGVLVVLGLRGLVTFVVMPLVRAFLLGRAVVHDRGRFARLNGNGDDHVDAARTQAAHLDGVAGFDGGENRHGHVPREVNLLAVLQQQAVGVAVRIDQKSVHDALGFK